MKLKSLQLMLITVLFSVFAMNAFAAGEGDGERGNGGNGKPRTAEQDK